jgi:hypothetical protein
MHEILLQQYEYRENEKKIRERIRQEHQVKLHLADDENNKEPEEEKPAEGEEAKAEERSHLRSRSYQIVIV